MSTIRGAASSAKTITIKDIELRNTEQRKSLVSRQFYVQFSIGDTTQSTDTAKEARDSTSWDDEFKFDGSDLSVLVVKVYQKHRFEKDTPVGSFTDTVGRVLETLKNGEFRDTLRDSQGSDLVGVTIKFVLVARPRARVRLSPLFRRRKGTQTFEGAWGELLLRMELFNKIVVDITEIHLYVSMAWSVISTANQVVVSQKSRDNRTKRLAGTMSDVLTFVHDAEPLQAIKAHMKTITLIVQQVTECGYFITDYEKRRDFWVQAERYITIDARITGYEEKLRELKTAFLEGAAVQTGITVVRMMDVVQETAESIVLGDMPYAPSARYQWEKGCQPGTRESLLHEICDVLNCPDEDAPRVCLLTGVAGSGKSAVAHSIAGLYDGQKRLGSSYCFSRYDVVSRNSKNLFSTIARDLCDHDPQYKYALWGVVEGNRAVRTSRSPMEQVEKLIIEPSKRLLPIGPLVIVVDALDESGDLASRKELLSIMTEKIADMAFPTNLRFLITTRAENDILDAFSHRPEIVHMQMDDIPEHVVDSDIEMFIFHSLHQYSELESSLPGREWCRLLVDHSQHLFQWASTACRFIQGEGTIGIDSSERLNKLLRAMDPDDDHSLDNLYHTILRQLFASNDTRARFQTVMAVILTLNAPLSLTSLCVLLGGDLDARGIIKPMASLLDGVIDEEKPVRPLHSSFHDFLLDEARSLAFHASIQPEHSLLLGRALLTWMRNTLPRNTLT